MVSHCHSPTFCCRIRMRSSWPGFWRPSTSVVASSMAGNANTSPSATSILTGSSGLRWARGRSPQNGDHQQDTEQRTAIHASRQDLEHRRQAAPDAFVFVPPANAQEARPAGAGRARRAATRNTDWSQAMMHAIPESCSCRSWHGRLAGRWPGRADQHRASRRRGTGHAGELCRCGPPIHRRRRSAWCGRCAGCRRGRAWSRCRSRRRSRRAGRGRRSRESRRSCQPGRGALSHEHAGPSKILPRGAAVRCRYCRWLGPRRAVRRGTGQAGAEPGRQPDQRAVPEQHQLQRRPAVEARRTS